MRFPRFRRLAGACRLAQYVLLTIAATAGTAAAATLTGHILDPDGAAVAGARVVLTTPLGAVIEQATDAAGVYRVPGLPAGRYDLRVVARGLQGDPQRVAVDGDGTIRLDIHLRMSAVSESVVVSASQVDLPLSRAADSVTVVTGQDLAARQIETVADALRFVPGLAVTRTGGRGAITSLFPRGGESNYTLVLVDGIRANEFGGAFDLSHLSTADIDRIEIVRGPESALFGSDAIGAVVQIVTRRGGRPRGDALVEGGSQGTARVTAGASGSAGAWSWGGGVEDARSNGYTGIAPATGERVSNDDSRFAHASGTLGWQRANGPDFLLTARVDRNERGLPGPFGSNPTGSYTAVDRISRSVETTRQVGGRFGHAWTPLAHQKIELNYTDLAGAFTSPYGPSTDGTHRLDGRVQEDLAFNTALGASAGVEFLRENGASTFITAGAGAPIPIRRATTGAFAELRYVGSERLFVTGGVRLERLTRDPVAASTDPFSPRPAFASQTVDSLNPKIAVSFVAAGGSRTSTRLHASAGTGIRPPDAFEIAFTNNPDLRPERSRSVDAGVEQQWAGGAYAASATFFFNRYDDLIVAIGRVLEDASRYQTDNISNARARGLELDGRARLSGALTVHASYTFLDTAVLSVDGAARLAPPPFAVGDPLLRRPRHQGALDVTFSHGRLSAFGELTTRSRALDVEPTYGAFGGLFFTPGYAVADAGASVQVAPHVSVYARVTNLTDRAYEEILGFPALRRSGIVGVRVAAGR
ncbi:MAG: TonB-dependent receptor [Betaproteobacteria bacterium]